MKVVVIGSGITGCISALNLNKKGHQVSIYDSSSAKGGNMHDIVYNKSRYFNGCQYLNSQEQWVENLRYELGCDFLKFEHTCGSYTSILDETVIHHDFPGPVIKRPVQELNNREISSDSLASRLSVYPSPIGSQLQNWLQSYAIDLDKIHYKCAEGVQLSRVYFDYDDHELIKQKQKSTLEDDLFGIPRSVINPESCRIKAYLPVKGYDDFFRKLYKFLEMNGINIFTDSPVVPKRQPNDDIYIFCREKKINADLFIWSGNPVPIINAAGFGKLDNPVCRMIFYVCNIDNQSLPYTPHYIQVFSNNSNITRIYLYEIDGVKKATLECFDRTGVDSQAVMADANKILAESGFNLKIQIVGLIRKKKYIFYTINDYKRFLNFDEFSSGKNVIGGAWYAYDHDEKISIISDQMNSRGYL